MPAEAPWSLNVPEQLPLTVGDSFVPWRDGQLVFPYPHGHTGYSYFVVQRNVGLGQGYADILITNATDSTLYVGQSGAEMNGLLRNALAVIAPYHAVTLPLRLGPVSFLCACAGYDFWTPRPLASGSFGVGALPSEVDTRGPSSRVYLNSAQDSAPPAPLRTSYTRVYDWFDLSISQAQAQAMAPIAIPAAIVIAGNSFGNLPNRVNPEGSGLIIAYYNSVGTNALEEVGNTGVSGNAQVLAQSSVVGVGNNLHTLNMIGSPAPIYVQIVTDATHIATWSDVTVMFSMSA